jgi:hypothetical protein
MSSISKLIKIKALLVNQMALFAVIPKKWVLIFLMLQFSLLALAFIVFGVLPVQREVASISNVLNSKQSQSQITQSQLTIDLANRLVATNHHEAYLKSHLQLSKADSISLLIDLHDSLAILTFNGVFLFKSKISSIRTNKGLKKLPLYLLDSMFSGPFMVEKEISTIEKFPIVVKKAPKDTLEANLANSAPVLPKQSDVFWFFTFNNGLAVEVCQQEDSLVGTRSAFSDYRRSKADWLRSKGLNAIFRPEQSGYTYQLSIEIPREDARSIYRALPIKPIVTVRYRQVLK